MLGKTKGFKNEQYRDIGIIDHKTHDEDKSLFEIQAAHK
jgi:hypothetical protein